MRPKIKTPVIPKPADQKKLPLVVDDRAPSIAPDPFPGEQIKAVVDAISEDDVVQKYVRKLANKRRDQVESILAFSKDCAEAFENIPRHRRREFCNGAEIGPEDFRKYVGIGRSKAFYNNPAIIKSLPANYTILYQARHLQPKELERAIAEGIIRPNANRKEIEDWVSNPANCRYQPDRKYNDEIALAKKEGRAQEVQALLKLWNDSPELVQQWRRSMSAVRVAFVAEIRKQKVD